MKNDDDEIIPYPKKYYNFLLYFVVKKDFMIYTIYKVIL